MSPHRNELPSAPGLGKDRNVFTHMIAILTNRGEMRLPLLFISLLVVGGGTHFFWDLNAARRFQVYAGYYFCMAAVLCAAFHLFRIRTQVIASLRGIPRYAFFAGIGLAIFGTYLMLLHEPTQMRVFADEPAHTLIAHSMAQERLVYLPGFVYLESGSSVFAEPNPSYRHYLFSFLVSLLHNLTGLRLANLFLFNAIVGFLLMGITFLLGWRIGGRPGAGLAAQLLLLSLPLLHQAVNSAGYDPLNLLLFAAFIFACWIYLKNGGPDLLNLAISFGILFAYCRSESIIYLVALGFVFLIRSIRERRFTLTWFAILSPGFLLVPIAARRIAQQVGSNLSIVYGVDSGFFSLQYFTKNLRAVTTWLISPDIYALSSLLISGLGSVALLVLFGTAFYQIGSIRRSGINDWIQRISAADLITFLFIVLSLIHLSLILCLYWNPADGSAVRFLLPFCFILILSISRAVFWIEKISGRLLQTSLIVASACFIWMVTLPKAAQSQETKSMIEASVVHNSIAWLKSHDDGRTLYAVNSPAFFFVHQIPVITMVDLGTHPESIFKLIEEGYFDQILIIESLTFDDEAHAWLQATPRMPLPPNLVLAPVDSWRSYLLNETTVRRVLGITNPDGSFTPLPQGASASRKWESEEAFFEHIRKLQLFRRYLP